MNPKCHLVKTNSKNNTYFRFDFITKLYFITSINTEVLVILDLTDQNQF